MPLTPQTAFALQSGDPVFRPPEAGGFVRCCRSDPLPVSTAPFRFPIASRNLPVRLAHQSDLHVPVPVSVRTPRVTGSASRAETARRSRHSDSSWASRRHHPPLPPFAYTVGCDPDPGRRVKCASHRIPKNAVEGARVPAVPGLFAIVRLYLVNVPTRML